jgi:hypothetical protein
MSDVVVGVVKRISGSFINGQLGQTTADGMWVYWDSVTSRYKLCQNDTTAAEARVKGVTLAAGDTDQEVMIQFDGEVDFGVELVDGQLYVISSTPGGFAKIDDFVAANGTGKRPSLVGMGNSNGNLEITIRNVKTLLP